MFEPRPGLAVTPNLRLVRLLGEGAMGSVWVAEHLGLDTKLAVKFISHTRPKDRPALVARFEREAKAAARIKSPHVVQVHDHGVMAGDTPYIVMELLEGETLGARLRRAGALSLAEVEQVVTHVGRALGKAHELGIVHRDIKPDNIFLAKGDDEMLVKVLDFGIAKQVEHAGDTMTQTGALLGTPLYMSPERIKSARDADLSADLWALAVVAYESITGKPPFSGETVGALFFAICGDTPTPPSEAREGSPPALDGWFSRALRPEAEKRFPSARDMVSAFRRSLGKETLDESKTDTLVAAAHSSADDAALATGEFVSKHELEIANTVVNEPPPPKQVATLDGTAQREPASVRRRLWPWAAAAVAALGGTAAFATVSQPAGLALDSFGSQWADDATAAASSVEAPQEAKTPTLSEEQIGKILDGHKPAYRDCYEQSRKRRPGLSGTLSVALVIGADGRARNVIVGGIADPPLRQCVREHVQTVRFPAPGAEMEVSYPIELGDRPAGKVLTTSVRVQSKKKEPVQQQGSYSVPLSTKNTNEPIQQQEVGQ
jgi:serine/threonine protein kinase